MPSMPARYAPLPNSRSGPDAESEMDDAFDDDDGHDHTESTPLTLGYPAPPSPYEPTVPAPLTIPGTYDFERDRDYDYPPPPGSPPGPSIFAHPNNFGNSNGRLPSSPLRPSTSRPSFFRRAFGALLPQHYQQVPTEPGNVAAPRGGGTDNDGVFANVMAKPSRAIPVSNDNGEVYLVPEEAQKETPPSYVEAQADAVPPYWETTIHAPISVDPGADMIVDDLPTGSIFFFVATMFVSYFFQFVGFILTYLLHTSHAAKYGSRAGLGLTLIQYGFYSRTSQQSDEGMMGQDLMYWNETAGMPMPISRPVPDAPWLVPPNSTYVNVPADAFGITSRDWLSLLLMTLGWFLLLWSLIGFYRVKRWESSIRASANPVPLSAEQVQRDAEIRRNIERAFGFVDEEANDNDERRGEMSEAEARIQRDLRAAGLL